MNKEVFIRLVKGQLACTDNFYEWSAYVSGAADVAFSCGLDCELVEVWLLDMWREKKEKKHD